MKGNTVRRNRKRVVQSIIKVPTELIKLHQDVELAIGAFLSTNTSSSRPIAQRSASPRSLIWHSMRKNISGKLSWCHTTCTYVEASISLWTLGIKNLLQSMHWPQFSQPPLICIGWLHYHIVGSLNVIYAPWKRRFICFTTVYHSQQYWALWMSVLCLNY